jgi:hypothetical protein
MNKPAIILVFILFLTPVLAAIVMHSEWISWQPGGGRNHGELFQPVIALPEFQVLDARQQAVNHEDLLDRWHLIHRRSQPCDEACLEDLYWLRQIRRAQDRHQPDVGLVLLSLSRLDADTLAAIESLAEDFIIIDGPAAETLAASFPMDHLDQASYITDPMANIILGYADDADPNGIRRDLRRLLTWTQRN